MFCHKWLVFIASTYWGGLLLLAADLPKDLHTEILQGSSENLSTKRHPEPRLVQLVVAFPMYRNCKSTVYSQLNYCLKVHCELVNPTFWIHHEIPLKKWFDKFHTVNHYKPLITISHDGQEPNIINYLVCIHCWPFIHCILNVCLSTCMYNLTCPKVFLSISQSTSALFFGVSNPNPWPQDTYDHVGKLNSYFQLAPHGSWGKSIENCHL